MFSAGLVRPSSIVKLTAVTFSSCCLLPSQMNHALSVPSSYTTSLGTRVSFVCFHKGSRCVKILLPFMSLSHVSWRFYSACYRWEVARQLLLRLTVCTRARYLISLIRPGDNRNELTSLCIVYICNLIGCQCLFGYFGGCFFLFCFVF